jgi:hypothetical protein
MRYPKNRAAAKGKRTQQPESGPPNLDCRRWHPVMKKYAKGTDYTLQMLMWECRGGSYYAGQVGGVSRFPTRRPMKAA